MLRLGETVEAKVERVVPSGVLLRKDDSTILVLATQTARTAESHRSTMASLVVGQSVEVTIVRFVEEDDMYAGVLN